MNVDLTDLVNENNACCSYIVSMCQQIKHKMPYDGADTWQIEEEEEVMKV